MILRVYEDLMLLLLLLNGGLLMSWVGGVLLVSALGTATRAMIMVGVLGVTAARATVVLVVGRLLLVSHLRGRLIVRQH